MSLVDSNDEGAIEKRLFGFPEGDVVFFKVLFEVALVSIEA